MEIVDTLVFGLGGTGSYLIDPLHRLLRHHPDGRNSLIRLFDRDKFEPKNLLRQGISPDDVGRYKSQVFAERLAKIDRAMRIEDHIYQEPYIANDLFLDARFIPSNYLRGLTLVIACVDNNQSRSHFLRALMGGYTTDKDSGEKFMLYRKSDWLFISPGNGSYDGQVMVYGYIGGVFVGINPLNDYPQIAEPTDEAPTYLNEDRVSCADAVEAGEPQTVAANFFAAAATLSVVLAVLENRDIGEVFFDSRTGAMRVNESFKLPPLSAASRYVFKGGKNGEKFARKRSGDYLEFNSRYLLLGKVELPPLQASERAEFVIPPFPGMEVPVVGAVTEVTTTESVIGLDPSMSYTFTVGSEVLTATSSATTSYTIINQIDEGYGDDEEDDEEEDDRYDDDYDDDEPF